MTTLKEFMKGTLNEITEALIEFQDEQIAKKSPITPFPLFNPKDGLDKLNVVCCQVVESNGKWAYYPVLGVNFDVAVEATQSNTTDLEGNLKGKVGLNVIGGVELSGSGNKVSEDGNSLTNRISFSVPVMMPPDPRLLEASMAWHGKRAEIEAEEANEQVVFE